MSTINIGITANGRYILGNPNVVSINVKTVPLPPISAYDGSVAFSVRNLFSGSYSGPCMRLRRSSDNAEQDIGFDSFGWLDESAALSFVGSSDGTMAAWYNQTPQYGIVKFIQPDATKQPLVITSGSLYKVGLSQRPAIKFAGTRWLRTEAMNVLKMLSVYQRTHMQAVLFMDNDNVDTLRVIFEQHETSGGYGYQHLSHQYRTNPVQYSAENVLGRCGYNGGRIDLTITSDAPTPTIPKPVGVNVHRMIGMDNSATRTALFWQGAVLKTGGVYDPMPDPVNRAATFHTYIGCSRTNTGICPFSIQEIFAMSSSWTDAQTISMMQNQLGAFS